MQTQLINQLQTFEPNSEIYNLTAGMEMIGFPSKNLHQETSSPVMWKWFFNKPGNHNSSPSPKVINEPSSSEFYQHDLAGISDITMNVSPDSYHQNRLMVDDSNLRCVFPCEGNERPSQGLSLSLSSSNPSTIGLQSFELRQQDDLRFGPSSSRSVNVQNQQNLMPGFFHFGNSKFLGPAQELLNEFCNLGTKQNDEDSKKKLQKIGEHHDDESVIKNQSLYSLDLLELQKRKAKLLHMLEEVDRRYKHYCDQMKAVVSSFESVAGNGAATVYSALASRAMSRHFRCLRDGIVSQIKATKKAMGDKDTAAPGTSKGETPRLRFIDQSVRQHRQFQQMSMMESHPWRPQRGLPERSVSVLRAWLFEHFLHPVRLWKPMVEEMYLEELKEQDGVGAIQVANVDEDESLQDQNLCTNEDQKPTHDQLIRVDSECLSSIINNPEKNNGKKNKTLQNELQNQAFGRVVGDSYGACMELDFSSSYAQHIATGATAATGSYIDNAAGVHSYVAAAGGGGGVSLTLGLQQHGGVSLSFSPTSQNSIFYPRDHMEDCQTVQYSLLDSEGQTLPYRNLMGAQLLHDLAG
ncbi:POX family protein isoform 1 [Dorcoceras hygrometricum]|uniref:POX family protein isoform 1 n=1 Tax=Dorcoceras hygrometricum TaxID=472368 RepID=A0A2Z7A8Y3_9LAMI|nr:POX family protein isoform 1 [Dorcoceras hygrometricum]